MRKLSMLLILLSASAYAASIEFQQEGWSIGGPLVISFTGTDTDLDGSLVADELKQFNAAWKTPGGALTKWGASEIEPGGFIFTDAGNFLLFIRNIDYSLVNTAFEGEFLATVFDSQLFPVDSTTGQAQVVPEPRGFGLLGAAIVLFSCRLRRVRRRMTSPR